ncbi:MAG: hypothetical protein M1829_003456 [Trizodia sp. TS-e1964]|nr:MAG: hypothetical protein M1829_003456 [Trizodia sp. TS-e1964]
MARRPIKHPISTHITEALHAHASSAKRMKRLKSSESLASAISESPSTSIPLSDTPVTELCDGVAPGGDLDPVETPLESSLPDVRSDKEAIEEYESSQNAARTLHQDIEDRLGQRSWVRGKSSIYVDAFNLALETVLQDEGELFDEAEMAVFKEWQKLDYEVQHLYVRLFLRKISAWHRINRLGYHNDISDLPAAVETLQALRILPRPLSVTEIAPGELLPADEASSNASFSFADGQISTLEEASSLLSLEELKALAKEAKLVGKNKSTLRSSLLRMSREQSGFHRPPDQDQRADGDADDKEIGSKTPTRNLELVRSNQDEHYLRKIISTIGPCIRLSIIPLRLFERVHLVFYRSTEWSEKSLTTIILARMSKRNFPEYIVCRSANIFPSRELLTEFEAAVRTQYRVDSILEFNGRPNNEGLQEIVDIADGIYPRWMALLKEEQRKEDQVYDGGEGAYMRHFSPAWIYTRIIHKSTAALARFKKYELEYQTLNALLDQTLFHPARRGAWYQRRALLEEHYMAAQMTQEDKPTDFQKKEWKKAALQTCIEGLQDRECHIIYHFDLQKRIIKLEKSLKVVRREQHDFDHLTLSPPYLRIVEGIQVRRDDPPQSLHGGDTETKRRSGKTVWIDEFGDGAECSVEEMCLSYYRSRGWKGFHSEGGILRTLFAYLFYDVLFLFIPNVFQTAYQTCPLDLHTDGFYAARLPEINQRLVAITNGSAAELIRAVDARCREKQTCIIGLDWAFALSDILEIVNCFDPAALATICQVMAQEYRHRGGGVPDLFLWRPARQSVVFAEVKSANDRLSDTQRLWIHVLVGAGVDVELCSAVAKEVRRL